MRCTRCGMQLDHGAKGIALCNRAACLATEGQASLLELERLDISYRTGRRLDYNELKEKIKKEAHASLRIQVQYVREYGYDYQVNN